MVFAVGLTGGIASGKTTAAAIFSSFGIEIFNADTIARELTEQNQDAYKKIVHHFGNAVLLEEGSLNRKWLRALIFANPGERSWLENLLHPLILEELQKRVSLCKTPYAIVEIPLLVTKKDYPYLRRILLITAPKALQISRIMQRDHCSEEQAQAILAAQADNSLRLEHADDVIINDSDFNTFQYKLERLHQYYLAAIN